MYEILVLSVLMLLYLYYQDSIAHYKNDPLIHKIKNDVSLLDPRISSIQFFSSDESYTEDKRKIYLCLRDENGKYYDYNMLIYVAIHECSHALTDVIDIHHTTPEFKNMFQTLLQKATDLGLYSPVKPLLSSYCGLKLNTENLQR